MKVLLTSLWSISVCQKKITNFAKTPLFAETFWRHSLVAQEEFAERRDVGKIQSLGADRKEVDKAFAELKKEGAIVSPVRCKWEPAK